MTKANRQGRAVTGPAGSSSGSPPQSQKRQNSWHFLACKVLFSPPTPASVWPHSRTQRAARLQPHRPFLSAVPQALRLGLRPLHPQLPGSGPFLPCGRLAHVLLPQASVQMPLPHDMEPNSPTAPSSSHLLLCFPVCDTL